MAQVTALKPTGTPGVPYTFVAKDSSSNQVFYIAYATERPPPYGGRQIVSGQWLANTGLTGTNFALIALRRYYVPIQVPYALVVNFLGAEITTIASSDTIKVGVLGFERGIVGRIIQQNIVTPNILGVRTAPMLCALSAGTYCLGIMSDGTPGVSIVNHTLIGIQSPDSIINPGYYYDDISDYDEGFTDDPTVIVATVADAPGVKARVQ